MFSFVDKLEKETDKKENKILSSDQNILKKSYDVAKVFEVTYNRLKKFMSTYQFADDAEEIHFLRLSSLD